MGGIVGAITGAPKKAAKKQVRSIQDAIRGLNEAQDRSTGRLDPYREAGGQGFEEWKQRLGIGEDQGTGNYGSLLNQFTGDSVRTDPGYQFGLQQGERGINNRNAGSGNYLSGAGMKEINRYNQDYAGTKFNEAYNRDALDKGRVNNYLSSLGQVGLNTTNQQNQNEYNNAIGIGNLLERKGNAQAAGIIGGANAWGGVIDSGIGLATSGLFKGPGGQNNPGISGGGFGGGQGGGFSGYQAGGNLLAGPNRFGGGYAPGSLDPSFFSRGSGNSGNNFFG